jgi:hypothetical protein
VAKHSTTFTVANNPITTSINTVTRTWNDTNGDYIPDCNLALLPANGECGAVNNTNFGGINPTIHYADDVIKGTGHRGYNWDFTAEVQRQLRPGVSMTGGYYRNWYGSFITTDNTLVSPTDYDSYCITAPWIHACPAEADIRSAAYATSCRRVRPGQQRGLERRTSESRPRSMTSST